VRGKQTDAVRLLTSRADETESVPLRVLVRGDRLLLDPVLSEAEAKAWQLPARAGLPEAPDQARPNLTLSLAVGTPTSLPGLRDEPGSASGGVRRELRSGHRDDNEGTLRGGFGAAGAAPRLLGALTTYLEKVEDVDPRTQEVTLFKHQLVHDVDQGDVLRLLIDDTGVPVVVTAIIADPVDDRGQPGVTHVRALVARTAGLRENDPRRLPGYPSDPRSPEGERWLVANAPRAVLDAEFTAQRRAPNGDVYGDDPRYFVQWSPAPLPNPDGSRPEPGDAVSPFAGAVVRFTKPIDPATVRSLDSLFFATRDLLDPGAAIEFVRQRNIDPATFDPSKFWTPHLVAAEDLAVDGAASTFRLQAPLGFYLDAAMRTADENRAFADKRYRYHMHVVAGAGGIKDRAGNQLDLGDAISPRGYVAIPFALDMRRDAGNVPLFADNHVASVCRRFGSQDEDEQPSYYVDDEIQRPSAPMNPTAFPLADAFGAVTYGDGWIAARGTTRLRKAVDDLNQPPVPPQDSVLRHCPSRVWGEPQIATRTAEERFGQPIQNPTNPYGARLQTVWREIDAGLSRTDPFDFNLDVEQMYWAVFADGNVTRDEFDDVSLWLGHAERRPEPCVGATSALPDAMPASGLVEVFADNYAHNIGRDGRKEDAADPHPAFVHQRLVFDASRLVREPQGVHRYLPMPAFQRPYFTWRDEEVMTQGASSEASSDVRGGLRSFEPYIVSPFLQGQGRLVSTDKGGAPVFNLGFWSNARNMLFGTSMPDALTGGLVGAIGLPLLADVQVIPDGNPDEFRLPTGANGWQIALTVQSSSMPGFRAYSGGGVVGGRPERVSPSSPCWTRACGGILPSGQRTPFADNSLYWAMADFVTTKSVMTLGFVELANPHRMQDGTVDPRLGPYFGGALPRGLRVDYAELFDPPLTLLPVGIQVIPEYRAAGALDPAPWRSVEDGYRTAPDARNFPLDPFKAGDAHIRKNDTRLVAGQPRDWWTHFYTRNLTAYTRDADDLSDPAFIARFAGPRDVFGPDDVRYFNCRLILRNGMDGGLPTVPRLDSFMVTYRFEPR
jgi:hypothetical protein